MFLSLDIDLHQMQQLPFSWTNGFTQCRQISSIPFLRHPTLLCSTPIDMSTSISPNTTNHPIHPFWSRASQWENPAHSFYPNGCLFVSPNTPDSLFPKSMHIRPPFLLFHYPNPIPAHPTTPSIAPRLTEHRNPLPIQTMHILPPSSSHFNPNPRTGLAQGQGLGLGPQSFGPKVGPLYKVSIYIIGSYNRTSVYGASVVSWFNTTGSYWVRTSLLLLFWSVFICQNNSNIGHRSYYGLNLCQRK